MDKPLHVNCFFVEPAQAQAFRDFVAGWDEPSTWEEAQEREGQPVAATVEILYEETDHRGNVGFDLWFATVAIAFYFGVGWERKKQEGGVPDG